jgi:hypothetical protein
VESKGESLLTKITSVDTLVGGRPHTIEGRLATLESKMGSAMGSTEGTATLARASEREPPDDPPPAAGFAAERVHAVDTTNIRAPEPIPPVVCDDASVDSMNVNERTRHAFANARARARTFANAHAQARTSHVSPVRNPYPPTTLPRPTLRQTTIPESIGRAPAPNIRVGTPGCDGDAPTSGACRPVVGGPIISP